MRALAFSFIVASAAGFGAAFAASEPVRSISDDLKEVAVKWDVGNEDWSKTCRIDLKTESAAHGMIIVKADDCTGNFPVMGKVASWSLAGRQDIELLDASGATVLRFVLKGGDDMYAAEPEVDGIYSIALVLD
jgi:hypothetical protein